MRTLHKMNDLCKGMKPGFMITAVNYNALKDEIETVFIIKDFKHKLEKIRNSSFSNFRASVEDYQNAKGLIFMVKFSRLKNKIYHLWFDKTIHQYELAHLINQTKALFYLADEKNNLVDILAIPNPANEIALNYLNADDSIWSVDEYNLLVLQTIKKYKSITWLWDPVTKRMA